MCYNSSVKNYARHYLTRANDCDTLKQCLFVGGTMADSQDFESKHPMATVKGKGNRFVPKGEAHDNGEHSSLPSGMRTVNEYEHRNGETVEQVIARRAKEHVPPAMGFANKERKNTRHHEQHARAMGYKNQKEYERAGCDFFNSNRGKLYYGIKRKRFYRYDEKTGELAISDNGVLHTYMPMSNKEFNKKIKEEQLYE